MLQRRKIKENSLQFQALPGETEENQHHGVYINHKTP